MYSSLRKNKGVSYAKNFPIYKDSDNNPIEELDKISENTPVNISVDTNPLELSDDNPQVDAVIKTKNIKPTILKNPKLLDRAVRPENLEYELPKSPVKSSSPTKSSKKSLFCLKNIGFFLFFAILLYCLYLYIDKRRGKSFFGARECASYDISRAYNIVK